MGALSGLVGCWIFLWGSFAAASSVDSYIQQVASLYRKGVKLTQQNQHKEASVYYLEALRWVRKALAIARSPQEKQKLERSEGSFLYVIGRNYLAGGECRLAMRYFRFSLAARAGDGTRRKVNHFMQVALQRPACQPASLTLVTTPPEAALALVSKGRQIQGKSPWQGRLSPGVWQVKISREGFQTRQLQIKLVPGQTLRRSIALARKAPAVATRPAASARWPRWVVLGGGILAVVAGVSALGWAGGEFGAVVARQGRPAAGLSEEDTFNLLKPRVDGGVAGMAVGIASTSIGAVAVGVAVWWLLQPGTTTPPQMPSKASSMLSLPPQGQFRATWADTP